MSKSGQSMHAGMKNRSPSASDASTKVKGGSVNADATRSATAKGHTLGPRTA